MHYNEILARRIAAEVARTSVDGGASQPVMLHDARRLKIDEASAESAMYRAVAERWLIVEGSSLFRVRLTDGRLRPLLVSNRDPDARPTE